jgi:GGDEF domain-containing protein
MTELRSVADIPFPDRHPSECSKMQTKLLRETPAPKTEGPQRETTPSERTEIPLIHTTLVYFALQSAFEGLERGTDVAVRSFPDFASFAESRGHAMGFVIGTEQAEKGKTLLTQLRRDPQSAVKPIFLLRSLGEAVDSISDGVVRSFEEAYERSKPIDRLIRELDPEMSTASEMNVYRVLGYLYARPDTRLVPLRHWSNESLYTFPLVDAMLDPAEDADPLLRNLTDRKLLKYAVLLNRLRQCPKCSGVHLVFVDVCPACTHIDISQKPFLHCFTCGNVAPEEDFLSRGTLACPNCNARLRHIGADYDRPLENYVCNACGQASIEPDIIAECQHCESRTKPEELVPRDVHSLEITERGRLAARTGSLEDMYALLDSLNNVSPGHFEFQVDWLLSLCQRHAEERFSLIGIRLQNMLELTERIGRHRMVGLMDEFVGRIRENLRSTDLTARTAQHNLWILLAKTDGPGCRIVLGRISEMETHTKQDEGVGLQFSSVTFSAPQDMNQGETAKLLMARLEGEMA